MPRSDKMSAIASASIRKGVSVINVILKRETLDSPQFHISEHCSCVLEDSEFLPRLVVIVEDAVVDAIQRERARLFEQLGCPSEQ